MRIAVVGGGLSGVTAAWQLARLGHKNVVLFEASPRLGGTVETVRRDGFVIEGGPDGWVSEKPWARELAVELGLEEELIGSNDAGRVTYIVQHGKLVAMPDSMRMMVPTDLHALSGSALFSDAARAAYAGEPGRAEELRQAAPSEDESIASFVRRHFGEEVLTKIAGPLLSGIFGGDVERLSVRAVMPRFVEMERTQGSLVLALAGKSSATGGSVFTSLRSGTGTLIDRMVAGIPKEWVRLSTTVSGIRRGQREWCLDAVGADGQALEECFDHVMLALPTPGLARMLGAVDERLAELLRMETSSAVLCTLAFDMDFEVPPGFGFLAPPGEGSDLLAGTFVDQKYAGRAPGGHRLLRGYYGGDEAIRLALCGNQAIAETTYRDLCGLLGALPEPVFSVVHCWPQSLPQYAVGHLERVREVALRQAALPGLTLLGNALRGVGLPDLIRDARTAARALSGGVL